MLSDFPVALTFAGERYIAICRDVPTAVFFYEYPNVPPGTKCSAEQTAAQRHEEFLQLLSWMRGLLPRVTVNPILTPELVSRLDDGANDAILAYCHAVGWFTDEDLERQAALDNEIGAATRRYQRSLGTLSSELLPSPAVAPAVFGTTHLPFVKALAPNIRIRIRTLALKGRVLPSVIWQAPISETMLNYRLLIEDEQKAPQPNQLTGDDALIGFED